MGAEDVRVEVEKRCSCDGKGMDVCPECGGRGVRESGGASIGEYGQGYDGICKTCKGKKKVKCLLCKGTGWFREKVSGKELLALLGVEGAR